MYLCKIKIYKILLLIRVEVLTTLTSDVGKILSKLHQVQPDGEINLHTGIRIAHLALKHRQGKNHKMRIIAFVGSPVAAEEKELVKLAKKLKKEKVNVDIISFGEESINSDVLATFVSTLNDGTSSHLVTVPPGPHLSDALISSPIFQGEDGTGAAGGSGFEFGVDPNEDPELALVSIILQPLCIQGVPKLNVKPKRGDRIDCNHHQKNQKKFYPM
nr:unnamed protein product [Callosobruchus analis]